MKKRPFSRVLSLKNGLFWSKCGDSNSVPPGPKENRSTCFHLFPGISAPFRSETHPFRRSYLHCFRVLRSCLWDKLWSSKTPRIQLHAASEVFFCRLYGNSCSTKSQGRSRNKFCTAVDKEKGDLRNKQNRTSAL